LFIFIFSLEGSYIIFKIQQYQIRKEIIHQIKQGVSENDLTSIVVTPETALQLNWEDNKEFSYKGNMYDVVSVEIVDANTKIYHCISDVQETKLIALYNKRLRKNEKNKNNRTNPVKLFQFLLKINELPQKDELAFLQISKKNNFSYNNDYTSLSLETSSPPPKQVL
jgi:hypothetical protein